MDALIDGLTHEVIGAAIEVHQHLGPGYLESVYEEALGIELGLRGVSFRRQVVFSLDYKGHPVGEGRMDLLVGEVLVVELKGLMAWPRYTLHRRFRISRLPATALPC
jgi:GxxExxY protein